MNGTKCANGAVYTKNKRLTLNKSRALFMGEYLQQCLICAAFQMKLRHWVKPKTNGELYAANVPASGNGCTTRSSPGAIADANWSITWAEWLIVCTAITGTIVLPSVINTAQCYLIGWHKWQIRLIHYTQANDKADKEEETSNEEYTERRWRSTKTSRRLIEIKWSCVGIH